MNELKYVKAGNEKLPFKFTKYSINEFEKKSGKERLENPSIEDTAYLCKYALEAGQRLCVKNPDDRKQFSIHEIWELDEQYDIIDQMMQQMADDEKKQIASSPD